MSESNKPVGQPVRHIVFDIGKVLIHYDPNIPYSRLIPDQAEREAFFDTVCTHEWNLEQDRGRSWDEAEALLIAEHPDKEELIRAFRTHWHEMVSHSYDDSVDIMLDLIQQGRHPGHILHVMPEIARPRPQIGQRRAHRGRIGRLLGGQRQRIARSA